MAVLKKSRIKDVGAILGLVTLVAGVSHFVITNPLGPSRLLYYVQAPVIQWNTRCTPAAPEWMLLTQKYATRKMAAPASQLAYVTPDGQLHHCETGWKDGVWGSQPLQPETRFRFASTTKTVTAAAVIDLINRGALSLDDAILDVLGIEGELKDPRVAHITIRHLLSHQGGWDRQRSQDVMFLMGREPWCPGRPENLLKSSLMHNPGEVTRYSNLGYCLLGLAIEKMSGQSYRDFVANHFDFNGSTLAFIDGPFLPDEVQYDFRFENFYMPNYYQKFDFQAISSSAGLSGSARDLAQLVSGALNTGPLTILDGELGDGCNPAKVQSCYGYGVYRYQPSDASKPLYIHGGILPGSPSAIVIDPEGGVLVWVGAGGPRPGSDATQGFYDFLYEQLVR